MSTRGPAKSIAEYELSDFSAEEKKRFLPLVLKFKQGEIDKKGIFTELKGNKEDCFKVMRLGQLYQGLLKEMQTQVEDIRYLAQDMVRLQHSIQGHRAAIQESRVKTEAAVNEELGKIKFGQ